MTMEVLQKRKSNALGSANAIFPYVPALVFDLTKPVFGICVMPNDPRGLGRYGAGSVRTL